MTRPDMVGRPWYARAAALSGGGLGVAQDSVGRVWYARAVYDAEARFVQANEGWLWRQGTNDGSSWTSCWDNRYANEWAKETTSYWQVGSNGIHTTAWQVYVDRLYFDIDTTLLSAAATVTTATLSLALRYDMGILGLWTGDFNIQAYKTSWTVGGTPGTWGSGTYAGEVNKAAIPAAGSRIQIDIDPSTIVREGVSQFYLALDWDIEDTEPPEPPLSVPCMVFLYPYATVLSSVSMRAWLDIT